MFEDHQNIPYQRIQLHMLALVALLDLHVALVIILAAQHTAMQISRMNDQLVKLFLDVFL